MITNYRAKPAIVDIVGSTILFILGVALFYIAAWDRAHPDLLFSGATSFVIATFLAVKHRARNLDHGIYEPLTPYVCLLGLGMVFANLDLYFSLTRPHHAAWGSPVIQLIVLGSMLLTLYRSRQDAYRALGNKSANDILLEEAMKTDQNLTPKTDQNLTPKA